MLSVSKTEYMRVQLRGRRSGLVSDSDSHISRLFFYWETERVPYSSVSFCLLWLKIFFIKLRRKCDFDAVRCYVISATILSQRVDLTNGRGGVVKRAQFVRFFFGSLPLVFWAALSSDSESESFESVDCNLDEALLSLAWIQTVI